MTNRNLLLALFSFLILSAFSQTQSQQLQTPLEATNYTSLSTNAQLVSFLEHCDSISNQISTTLYPVAQKKYLPMVLIAKDSLYKERMNVMLMAQQHGNEPSGKEGLLLLIKDIANGHYVELLNNLNLIIFPQSNPTGGDLNRRRTSAGIDLNRDHLLLQAEETCIIQSAFNKYMPQMTVDFHEYYPFGKEWINFGYRRNFDIQIGGLTNVNIEPSLRNFFYQVTFPYVKTELEKKNYSCFEYTLGSLPDGERLRHSTVDVNDGRQSFGIAGTFSLIIEGINGRDSTNNLERRAKSQYATALALLNMASDQYQTIDSLVKNARSNILADEKPVSIRQEHFKSGEPLNYPLLSVKTGMDTIFYVEEFHPLVKSLLDVEPPLGYLIPKSDTLLVDWLLRSNFSYTTSYPKKGKPYSYRIKQVIRGENEGISNFYPEVEKVASQNIKMEDYYFVSTHQIYRDKIITALEPQAMYGLVYYPAFGHLLKASDFPILRLE